MTNSADSIMNSEVTEDDIRKLTQQIPLAEKTPQELLKTKESETEQRKVSQSKISSQMVANAFTSKKSQHDSSDVIKEDHEILLQTSARKESKNSALQISSSKTKSSVGNIDPPLESSKVNSRPPSISDLTKENLSASAESKPNDNVISENKPTDATAGAVVPEIGSVDNANKTVGEAVENKPLDTIPENKLADMVPENMYSVLQQRAQNVLKIISDRRNSEEAPHISEGAVSQAPPTDVSTPQCMLIKSNECANAKSSKTCRQGSNNFSASENKCPLKTEETAANEDTSLTAGKPNELAKNISYTAVQSNLVADLLKNNTASPVVAAATTGDIKSNLVPPSDSQLSSRSTEQFTTDYNVKTGVLETASDESQKDLEAETAKRPSKLSEQCIKAINENVCTGMIKGTAQMPTCVQTCNRVIAQTPTNAQNPNEVIKQLSQMINSNEMPVKLTKKGEMISQLFKQKLLTKLESEGTLDEKSGEIANITAVKFAKWMEDILKEIDTRKKRGENLKSDDKGNKDDKEHEDEFISAASSKESMSRKDESSNTKDDDVIKIQEISDTELMEKYGTALTRQSRHELFHFIGPDNTPVEVRHIYSEDDKKIMIVKKKTSDTQWSNWVVEVGPEVTLESVSGIGNQN